MVLLLASPQPDSPLNCDAGHLLRMGDVRGYWSLARMCTLDHAIMLRKPPAAPTPAPEQDAVGMTTPAGAATLASPAPASDVPEGAGAGAAAAAGAARAAGS